MDVDRGIRVAVDTGDVILGSEKSIQSLKLGKGQLVVVASNATKEILEDVEYYANLSEIPSLVYDGTSVDLGSVCEIRFIALFENMTGAMVKDCIIDDEHGKVTFVVKNGDMGLAIGKGGSSVSKVQRAVDKGIEIVELDEDPIQFIKNCLSPAKLQSVKISQKQSGEKIAIVTADNTNKRIAIGKNGINIERAKLLAERQHNIDNIILK